MGKVLINILDILSVIVTLIISLFTLIGTLVMLVVEALFMVFAGGMLFLYALPFLLLLYVLMR